MHIQYFKEYSSILQRNMEYKVFGHAGKPCLIFPAQNGTFFDFENYGMVEAVSTPIEEGKLQLFCVQSIDQETWSAHWDPHTRIEHHERWMHYVCDELLPRLHAIHNQTSQSDDPSKFMCAGVSMGAYHALNFVLRRPEIFDACIGLSGLYHAGYFFPHYNDPQIYMNSPLDTLQHIDYHHEFAHLYRTQKIMLCCGQGQWEEQAQADAHILKREFARLGVNAWVDFWGHDVAHDWPWWRLQWPYFMSKMLKELGYDS